MRGHLLLSFIACTIVSMLNIVAKLGSLGTLESLRSLDLIGCTRYEGRVVVDPMHKKISDVFKATGIECPHRLPLAGGRLCYTSPPVEEHPLEGMLGLVARKAEPW